MTQQPMRSVSPVAVAAPPLASRSPDTSGFGFDDLRVFTSVPEHHHDVAALLGMVVVYETDTLCSEGVKEGALYVVESQQPVGGMSWDTFDRLNSERGPRQPRVSVKTSRRIVRAVRCDHDPDQWWQVLPSGHHDGLSVVRTFGTDRGVD